MKKINVKITAVFMSCALLLSACKKTPPPSYQVEAEAKTILDVSYGTDQKHKMDVYLPANRTSNTGIIILVHGGASISGDKTDLKSQASLLSLGGYAVMNVNYRLVNGTGILNSTNPPHLESEIKIKDQVADLGSAVDFARSHAKEWVLNANRVVMIGYSAGGNLSLLYAYDTKNNGKVRAVANLAGAVDFIFTDIPNWQLLPPAVFELGYRYTGFSVTTENEKYYKEISPLYIANADRKIPTLNVVPQNNQLMGLPKLDLATYNGFKVKLSGLNVPNELYFMVGTDHYFSQAGKWELALSKSISFFNEKLELAIP